MLTIIIVSYFFTRYPLNVFILTDADDNKCQETTFKSTNVQVQLFMMQVYGRHLMYVFSSWFCLNR